jgi:5-methylcytosine-specific restriction endonuclease McrA
MLAAASRLPTTGPMRSRTGGRARQRGLFCSCGGPLPRRAARCRSCTHGLWYSRRRFGGNREAVLERDGYRCRSCGAGKAPRRLHVHHRRPGQDATEFLITLCARCHARVHCLRFNGRWLPEPLLVFWREQHPASPLQLQLPIEAAA